MRITGRVLIFLALSWLWAAPAIAQVSPGGGGGVNQSGSVTNGNCTKWLGNNTVADAGGPCGGSGSPGGVSGQIQFNNAGSFGGTPTGTGVLSALGVNPGTAGSFVVNGGALGTPSSGTLTSATGLPISTGLTGAGTGVITALGVNVGTAGSIVVNGGALGTPSSGTLTNATGLPIAGLSGLGTGVGTWLATPSSANLAAAVTGETGTGALVFGTSPTLVTPALGTPSSATLTNATGLPIAGVTGWGTSVAAALGNALNGSAGPIGALTPTNNNCVVGNGTAWASAACPGGGGGSLTVTDGTHSVASTTTLTVGNGFVVGGSAGSATLNNTVADNTKTTSYTVAAADMANALNLGASSGTPALTLPVVSSTVFSPGMTVAIAVTGTVPWTVTNSTGLSYSGPTTLPVGTSGTLVANANGTSLDFFGTANLPVTQLNGGTSASSSTFWRGDGTWATPAGGGNVSTSGTINTDGVTYWASGTGAASTAAMTNGQLLVGQTSAAPAPETVSGDCTLAASGAITCTKTSGTAFGTAATQNTGTSGGTLPFLNGTNTWSGAQTFGETVGTVTTQSGTTYTFAATDCGTLVRFSSTTTVTATIPQGLPVGCNIAAMQANTGQVKVNGSAVTPATLLSAHSYTGTFNAAGAIIGISTDATNHATLTGDGA